MPKWDAYIQLHQFHLICLNNNVNRKEKKLKKAIDMTSVLESDDNNGTRIVTSCNGEPDFIRK
jgi:hypothetical protein